MRAKTTWVLLADGAQARLLEYKGRGLGLEQVEGMVFKQQPIDNKDIMSDAPGRSFNRVGDGRAAMAYPTDPVQHREAAFMADMAEHLNACLTDGRFEELVIAAAPRALGDLRKALSKQVAATVVAEIDKDLTNIPPDKLESHFDGVLKL